jgi:hypothetical protein
MTGRLTFRFGLRPVHKGGTSLFPRRPEDESGFKLGSGFNCASDAIDARDFGFFVEFVRCRSFAGLARARALSFLSISEQLGNESLTLALLSSLNIE